MYGQRSLQNVFFPVKDNRKWGLCKQVINHMKLPPSPVILWKELDGKPKWLPLNFRYHDMMCTDRISTTENVLISSIIESSPINLFLVQGDRSCCFKNDKGLGSTLLNPHTTMAKKIETATQAKHRRVHAREITRLRHVRAIVSIFLARVGPFANNTLPKTNSLVVH